VNRDSVNVFPDFRDRNSPMISLMKNTGSYPWNALALILGIGIFSVSTAEAQTDCPACASEVPKPRPTAIDRIHAAWGTGWVSSCGTPVQKPKSGLVDRHNHPTKTQGVLGYGPPGVFTGFQGFGLGYHLGYGYGGDALGVGADGGYPFYGGPGYPHCEPVLNRFHGIAPFAYYGGPGGPVPNSPNFYGGVGSLTVEPPVITVGEDRYDTGYGPNTGAIPYPESVLAPFTSRIAESRPSSEARPTPNTDGTANPPSSGLSLGIDTEPVVDAGRATGLKVSKVDPGSPAEKAGLQAGDVIQSVNGYLTEEPGNMTWIISQKAPDRVLTMNALRDGQVRVITAQLR
jgi:PDZ domain